ncbi:MAG: PaaI family thioesterase [Candidatus Aureabacteria bacterium]|nr:PaaI family thioesterase [Candidatus Auribacterota bacterium]
MSAQIELADDRWCFACGEKNPIGLKLSFTLGPDRTLRAAFTFGKEHQGYAGIVHGGLVGLILDEVMLNLAWRLGHHAVTAGLELRYRKPVRVGERIFFAGRITGEKGRLLTAEADARDGEGAVVATATAKCLVMK